MSDPRDDRDHRLLREFNRDPERAGKALFAAVYADLRRMARHQLARESGPVTLNPTALVHEAFVRFSGSPPDQVRDRAHFVRLMARVMRQFLIDHARRRQALKRGMEPLMTTLDEQSVELAQTTLSATDLLALDSALIELDARDPDMARVVELRYFGGFSNDAIASTLEVSVRTVNRHWQAARAWLLTRLDGD